ncbi:PHP family phosphohydrolase, histidinol phosphatase [Halobacteroides halobius DSM 5150]|uniref:PHP family phosphohydrolase, histidinol phosphatase n=1 Tax=Halobacteroides halobius (strain ATCC 35273 / DSM 5150 / MD-1) TaxID=748449 RepID=L0KBS4_HALHC|nr:phosphatase [Halobacteroides halobius]AGB42000.1 PHP family phosphohydrolase, histidinol phosphatase [Halobacteroides halobius DSM 5150]
MNLVVDLHTHTVASGHAYCTVNELAKAAKEKGIKMIGITDHGPSMPGGAHPYHFANLKVLPKKISGVRVLKGIEANITDRQGTLDLSTTDLAKLDIVLVGLHNDTGYNPKSKKENTKAMLNAIVNPLVDIIVHPGNPAYKVNLKEVVQAAKEHDTLLEINNSSYHSRPGSKERCIEIARQAKKEGLKLILGTDTHYADQLGLFPEAIKIIEEAGLEEGDIINTSLEKVKDFINSKRKIKEEILNKR